VISVEERRTQHQKFNIPDQILNGKFPPLPYHITQLLQQQASELTRGMPVDKNQRESEQESERASERDTERESARESTGGVREEDKLAKKKRYTTSRKTRGESTANYILNHSFTWMNELTFSSFFLSFIHSFMLHLPSSSLSVKPFFRLLSSVDPNDNDPPI
jgi:hypothetical protein